jgi:lycopene cyclase domain-containing protein
MTDSPVGQDTTQTKKVPWYLITIIAFFVVPITALLKKLKTIDKPAFIKATLTIMALGYIWSYTVTSNGWWVFNPNTMLGFEIIPHLPLEEVLFYPLGGALSILIYIAIAEWGVAANPVGKKYFWSIVGITALVSICVVISTLSFGKIPWYIISQMVLFNGLSIGLWFRKTHRISLNPALLSIAGMTVIGFFWNWIAFTQNWWTYHAVLGWYFPPQVPVDDWNFFIFAPLAAASLYEIYRKKENT